jgi:outer membrane protein TolC
MATGLTQPLFDGGRLRAQKRAASDRYDAAMASYRKTVLAAFGQVADALQAQADDADLLRRQTEAAQAAADALDLARRSYAAGASGVLDVIDAQRSYARAQIAVTRAQAQRLADTVRLESALGAGASDR